MIVLVTLRVIESGRVQRVEHRVLSDCGVVVTVQSDCKYGN